MAGAAQETAAAIVTDVVGEVRRAAERLCATGASAESGDRLHLARAADARDETRRFWSSARMLRAAQPPLLLPHRSPGSPRIGYVVDTQSTNAIAAIANAHADGARRALLLFAGPGADVAPAGPILPRINLAGMSEAQAVRMIANADLDALVDVGGVALARLPLVIALRPARAIIEPLCDPMSSHSAVTTGGASFVAEPAASTAPGEPRDASIGSLIDAAFRAADDAAPSLPAGTSAIDLAQLVDHAVRSHRAGALDAARQAYVDVLARHAQHPIALYLLGQLSTAQGLLDDAIDQFSRSAAAAPEFRDAHYALGQRLAERGDWAGARRAYEAVIELTPQFPGAWSGAALAALRFVDADAGVAIECLQRAVALEPASAQWLFNLGTALQHAGRLADARDAYAKVLQIESLHRDARFNWGAVMQELREYPAAIQAYERVLAIDPSFAPAYPELGACLQSTGQVEAWLDNFRRFRERCPPSLPMAVYGLEASMAEGDVDAHFAWRDAVLRDESDADDEERVDAWEQLLFLLLHVDVDRATLRGCYERYDTVARALYGSAGTAGQRRPGTIRVGYVSGDLRDHVMGRMVHEWVAHHDRERFAVTLYSLSREADEWTERFRALDVAWVDLASSSLRAACARIAADDIDILVDCSGHTRGARPGIFARKPARIQATHIATPGPLGLRSVDYKLTDALSEADDAQRYLIETLMPVPGGVFPWHRYETPPAPDRPRSADDEIVCGAFVSLMKLSPRCLALWRRLLEALPNAVLAFSPPSTQWHPSYLRWLTSNGIPSRRVRFIPYDRSEEGRLARYAAIDVALDPMPCGNVNGTMEALAMGVPVVTRVGVRHGERLGNALLQRFGVVETIAHSDDDYIGIVATLAHDPVAARTLRARIRDLALNSPVWDSRTQVARVEAVYERMLAADSLAVASDPIGVVDAGGPVGVVVAGDPVGVIEADDPVVVVGTGDPPDPRGASPQNDA